MMNDQQRMAVFLFGCIPARLTLAWATYAYPQIAMWPLLAIAVGIATIYVFRLRPTGYEAGGRIWWDNLRPLHAMLYATAAFMAWKKIKYAWVPVVLDAIIGLVAVVLFRTQK